MTYFSMKFGTAKSSVISRTPFGPRKHSTNLRVGRSNRSGRAKLFNDLVCFRCSVDEFGARMGHIRSPFGCAQLKEGRLPSTKPPSQASSAATDNSTPTSASNPPATHPPTQLGLFPRKTTIEFPKSKVTADAMGEAEVDDGHRYYLKTDPPLGTAVRASEWISTHLAERVGIAAPQAMPIECQDGQIVFGSRRVAGVADDLVTANYLRLPSSTNAGQSVQGLSGVLSSIYAFDLFVFNDDRHFGNYLSVDDNGVRRFYAFDFSRAMFWKWPWSGFPDTSQNTRQYGVLLRSVHAFDMAAAAGTLDRIRATPPAVITNIINEMPPGWASAQLVQDFTDWWGGAGLADRVKLLREGLSDGTLL